MGIIENLKSRLFGRTAGHFPISIGTSLAIEGLLGIHPEQEKIKNQITIKDVGTVWISVRTLIRNIFNATDPQIRDMVGAAELAEAIEMEIEEIRKIFDMYKAGVRVGFYICKYERIHKTFPYAKIKKVSGSIANYAKVEVEATRLLMKNNSNILAVETFDAPTLGNTLILTHSPLDLVTLNKIHGVYLWESHTGVCKDYSKWNSKFTGSMDMSRIPFTGGTLQICGDGGYLFSPIVKYKNRLIRLASQHNWTTHTKYGKMYSDAILSDEKELAEFLKLVKY